jgi:DNA-binding CsgD family transcriptional regulator
VGAEVLRRVDIEPVGQVEPLLVLALVEARTGRGTGTEPLERAAGIAAGTGEIQRLAPVMAARAELGWLSGDTQTPVREAEALWPLARDADCRWNRGMVATWLGPAADVDPDRLAPPYALEVTGRWREAADQWQVLDCPYERALALARSGDRDALVEAVGDFERLGAVAAADRARILLRTSGWAAPRRTRSRAAGHPAGLTDRETEVLTLLAEGLPDAGIAERLVISRRTVEHHVSAILVKLGVRSRQQAVARSASD